MVDFTLWDIFRNLLIAAQWTVGLSFIAFLGGGLVGLAAVDAAFEQGTRHRHTGGHLWCRCFRYSPAGAVVPAYYGLGLLASTPRHGSRRAWA